MTHAITAMMSAANLHVADMKADGLKRDTIKQNITVDDEQVTVVVQLYRKNKPVKRDRTGEARKRV